MDYEIECDACGSHKVSRVAVQEPKPPMCPVLKISEVVAGKAPQPSNTMNAVMTYSTYKLHCNNCGFESEPITENDQLGSTVVSVDLTKLRPGHSKPHGKQPLQVNSKSHNYL